MNALVPPLLPYFGWPYGNDDITSIFVDSPLPDLTVANLNVSLETNNTLLDNPVVMKKLNHNASERDRRRKINAMFSSLRSCLPITNPSKKLSVSATVTQALKYIPELQEQVKKLTKKKEELSSQISGQRDLVYSDQIKKQEKGNTSCASVVSATRIGEYEMMVHISSLETDKCSFGNMLRGIEEDGLVLVDASSSKSQGERLFYTLNLQMNDWKLNSEDLSVRLLNLYRNCGNSFI